VTFLLAFVSLIALYTIISYGLTVPKDFQSTIDNYLRQLFPHSNNEAYARTNIPVLNNVRTN